MKRVIGGILGFGLWALALAAPATSGSVTSITDIVPRTGVPQLSFRAADGTAAHLMPNRSMARAIALANRTAGGSGDLTYHGGRVMTPNVTIYTIFWKPAKLQTGAATTMASNYITTLNTLFTNYAGHDVANVNTQYYQTISGITTYLSGQGSLGGTYTDTANYPASGCTDSATPGACLSDAQIRAEISKVMTAKGWTGGFNKIYLLFTAQGEGSCYSGTACAYTAYCAYHSWYGSSSNPVIYGNEPYGNGTVCLGAGAATPNGPDTDAAASAARHEVSEASTDPLMNGWFDAAGQENSDKCAYQFGTKTWTSSAGANTANYNWGGAPFLLQLEYSNHSHDCVLSGP